MDTLELWQRVNHFDAMSKRPGLPMLAFVHYRSWFHYWNAKYVDLIESRFN